MALNYVTLTLDLYDGQGNRAVSGQAAFTPSAVLTDAGVEVADQYAVTAIFGPGPLPSVKLLATDNSGPLPSGWTWGASFSGRTGAPAGFSFFLPAGAVSFTATNASPAVFTVSSGTAPVNGTGVQLSGGSLPAGFTAGTTYYVVSASGAAFQLAATQGGAALGSTSAGSGTVTTVSQLLSNLIPVQSGTSFQAYMPLSGGQFTGGVEPAVAILADAPTVAISALAGNDFRLTLGGNHQLANPTGMADGWKWVLHVTQGGSGGFTLSYGSAYEFSTGLPQPALSTAPGATDLLGFIWNAAKGKHLLAAFMNGFA